MEDESNKLTKNVKRSWKRNPSTRFRIHTYIYAKAQCRMYVVAYMHIPIDLLLKHVAKLSEYMNFCMYLCIWLKRINVPTPINFQKIHATAAIHFFAVHFCWKTKKMEKNYIFINWESECGFHNIVDHIFIDPNNWLKH